MKKEIVPIKDVIKTVLTHLNKERGRFGDIDIFKIWGDAVGEDIARHTKPLKLKQGELVVLVDSSSWLYELRFRYRATILKELKDKIGEETINHIHFRIGDVKEDDGKRD